MLAIFRWSLGLFRKERELFSNYSRAHPHFFWYLGIDALLSVGIVLGGFALYTQRTSDTHERSHLGSATLTSEALIKHVIDEDTDAYWLGSISTAEYSINNLQTDIADIFYRPKGSFGDGGKQFLYEVKTYKNQKAWDGRTHTLLATANTETIAISNAVTIRINRGSMKGVIVTFTDRPEIIGIAYPTPQSLEAMIKNVESLEPIQ
ncbi:MAG: hypothetical protein HY050_11020 [Actinobacteria bacterium]|nr:hypothetical protein [Actinomycetota bacterium]